MKTNKNNYVKKARPVTKISSKFAKEAFMILSNYCKQEAHRCSECMFRDKRGICFFYGELLEKRKEFDEKEKRKE